MQTPAIRRQHATPVQPTAAGAASLEVRLLGGLSLRRGGQPLALPTRKCMGLLAILALTPGTPVTRERLAELLWSRSDPAHGRASLRQALALLRRILEGDGTVLIESTPAGVRLRPECIAADTAELESALAAGSPESLARAAALYRGRLLDGFVLYEPPFDDWIASEAERLRQRVFSALTWRPDRQAGGVDPQSVLRLGERLLALSQAAEDARRTPIGSEIGRRAPGSAIGR